MKKPSGSVWAMAPSEPVPPLCRIRQAYTQQSLGAEKQEADIIWGVTTAQSWRDPKGNNSCEKLVFSCFSWAGCTVCKGNDMHHLQVGALKPCPSNRPPLAGTPSSLHIFGTDGGLCFLSVYLCSDTYSLVIRLTLAKAIWKTHTDYRCHPQ